MSAANVQLSAAMRANLLQLQKTETAIGQKQNILATGNKVNSALDGPTSYFAAKGLNQRASDLSALKEAMGQGISTIKAADKGLDSIDKLLEQARGLTTAAYSALGDDAASVATRKNLAKQFNDLKSQIDALASDSGYAGKNLLAGDGVRLDTTQSSRASVNTITGVDNARVTNVVSTDTYSVRIRGDGSIEGTASDISDAERAHGLTGLNISGKMSGQYGSFSDTSIEVGGSNGRLRSFVLSDGNETRTINYFDDSQTATSIQTQAAKTNVAGTYEVEFGGTIEAGDTFSIMVEGKTFTYTATETDTAFGSNAVQNIATALSNSITAAMGVGGSLVGSDLASVTVTADNKVQLVGATDASRVRELSVRADEANAATLHISQSFASGTVVSFTVDRKALENAPGSGNGVASIQKKVDIQVEVTNLQGQSVIRDGMNARGEGKLATGENAFKFGSGTVRFDLDEHTIQNAASVNASSNIMTVQVAAANTQNDLTVQFNERNTNSITIKAQNLTTSGQGMQLDYAANNWTDRSDIDEALKSLDYAKAHLRSVSQTLSTNLNIVTTREDFTKEFSDVLTEGSGKLTLADQNEEGANLLALQTRQQLGTISLSLANQSQQSILKLF
jgi:flagellin